MLQRVVTYSSCLIYEQKTEERLHTHSSKPRIDYIITGRAGEDLLYVVPVETKKKSLQKDMAQLAQYMVSLAQGTTNTCVGYLLDEDTLHIVFAPLALSEMLVPLVLISPALKWRMGTSLNRGACVPIATAFYEEDSGYCGGHP